MRSPATCLYLPRSPRPLTHLPSPHAPHPTPAPSQVIFALPAQGATDYSMRIFNSDGSEPEMCGNGIRCLARFVAGAPAPALRAVVWVAGAECWGGAWMGQQVCRKGQGKRRRLAPLVARWQCASSSPLPHCNCKFPPLLPSLPQTWMARSRGSTRCTPWRASSSRRCCPTARCGRGWGGQGCICCGLRGRAGGGGLVCTASQLLPMCAAGGLAL